MRDPARTEVKRPLRGPGFALARGRRPLIMGVLNVTPDSFSDGGDFRDPQHAFRRAMEMCEQGADIVDIGGESTRPGAKSIGPEEEIARILPVIEALAPAIPVPVSVDTRHAAVARAALDAGCRMINDVSACGDPAMSAVAAEFGVPIVLMHMRGEPESMQSDPRYGDVVSEVRSFLAGRAKIVARSGLEDDMIVLDPGIGFGKRFRDNLDLIRSIPELAALGHPVMIGASRKRFLGELLGAEPRGRLSGNLAVAAWCFRSGTDMVRVHDVKETAGLFRVLDAIEHPEDYPASW